MPIALCPATSRGIIIDSRTTVHFSPEGGAGRHNTRENFENASDNNDNSETWSPTLSVQRSQAQITATAARRLMSLPCTFAPVQQLYCTFTSSDKMHKKAH